MLFRKWIITLDINAYFSSSNIQENKCIKVSLHKTNSNENFWWENDDDDNDDEQIVFFIHSSHFLYIEFLLHHLFYDEMWNMKNLKDLIFIQTIKIDGTKISCKVCLSKALNCRKVKRCKRKRYNTYKFIYAHIWALEWENLNIMRDHRQSYLQQQHIRHAFDIWMI